MWDRGWYYFAFNPLRKASDWGLVKPLMIGYILIWCIVVCVLRNGYIVWLVQVDASLISIWNRYYVCPFYSMSGTVRLTVIGWALVWHSSVVIVLWPNWLGNAAPISPIPEVYSSTHMGTVVRWRPAWWQIAVSIAASVVQISTCVLNVYPVVLLAVLLGWGGQEASVPCWCMACAAPAGQCPGWP